MKITPQILERLDEVIRDTHLTRSKFAEVNGFSRGTLGDIFRERIGTLSNCMINLLQLKYSINPVWLETGEGEKQIDSAIVTDPEELRHLFLFRRLREKDKNSIEGLTETFYEKMIVESNKVAENSPPYGKR